MGGVLEFLSDFFLTKSLMYDFAGGTAAPEAVHSIVKHARFPRILSELQQEQLESPFCTARKLLVIGFVSRERSGVHVRGESSS